MQNTRLVVVGASLGGVAALRKLAKGLPAGFPAPVLVVLHIGSQPSVLPSILSDCGPLTAQHPREGEAIRPGYIYVAPPDHHMLVDGTLIRLVRGPKEHHSRPAVDPLFRSAALSRGSDVIGVVLTGLLDDGTPGLQAIKAYGGIAIVQDPQDAEAPSMPRSALRHVEVDHCLPLASIPGVLMELAGTHRPPTGIAAEAEQFARENDVALSKGDPMEHLQSLGAPSTFVCPDCKGTLWEVAGSSPQRYRCHTGHGFTLRTLTHARSLATDEALWGAIRALQEKQLLIESMATAARAEGEEAQALQHEADVRTLEGQTAVLRELVEKVPTTTSE